MYSNNGKKVTKKSQTQLKWFSNVAKSLGYASADMITDLVPASSQFVKSNYESTTELIQEMRQNRSSGKRLSQQIANLEQLKIAETGIKNALADIKSGKIYNKDREFEYMESQIDSDAEGIFTNDFGDDDFSFGDDFDSGDEFESIDIDDSDPDVTNIKKVNVKNVNNNIGRSVNMLPLAKAMNNQTAVLANTMHNTSQAQLALNTEFMMLYNSNTSNMVGGLTSINDNLSLLVNFQNDNMAKYIGASLKYYEDHLNKVDESLKLIKDGFTGQLQDTRRNINVTKPDDIFLAEGALDIKEYVKMIRKNIKREAEANEFVSAANMIWSDTETLREMVNSPLKTMITGALKSTIPKSLKDKLSETDEVFSNFFPALMNRMSGLKDVDNAFLQFIGRTFTPERQIKKETSIDLGNYNKAVIGFDGESKKALVEVIPTYLRKIESLMSGQEEKIYDYEKGKFKSANKLKENLDNEFLKAKTSGYVNFKSEFKKIFNEFDIGSDEQKKEFYDELDRYLVKMTERGKAINPLKQFIGGKEIDELTSNGLFLDEGMRDTFAKIYKQLPKKVQNELLGSGINDSINRLNRLTTDIERNPHKFGFAALNDDSKVNELFTKKGDKLVLKKGIGLGNQVDSHGLSQLDYLRDIKFILSKGIVTFPNNTGRSKGKSKKSFINPHSNFIEDYNKKPEEKNSPYTTFKKFNRLTVNDAYKVEGFEGLNNLSDEEITEILNRNKTKEEKPRGFKTTGAYKFLDKFEKLHGLRDAAEKLLDTPVKVMEDVSTMAQNTMFTLLHGIDEGFEPRELSEKLKTQIFGDVSSKKGEFKFNTDLPSKFRNFFSENKLQLKVGGGIGLLSSFFLPGGPIGGALLGMGAGLATKSDRFQKFIYGDNFKNDKDWKSGFFGRQLNKFGGKLEEWGIDPEYVSYLSAGGAGLGLLSSFFLPFGPVGGALLGLSGGIAASSSKFQEWLFGEKGEDDIRRGGVLSKFSNWFNANVKDAVMIKVSEIGMDVSEFFHKSIATPFLDAIGPLKHMLGDVADKVKDMFYKGWETINENVFKVFHENVAKPFGETLEKFVLDPLKGFMSKTLSIVGKTLGTVISAPFKALGFVSDKIDAKNEKNVLAKEKQERWDNDLLEMKEKLAKKEITWKDFKNFVKNRGDLKGDAKDQFLKEALPYRDLAADAKAEREKKHAEKQAARQEKINEMRSAQGKKIAMGKETDFRYISEEQKIKEKEEIERNLATQKALSIFDQIKDTMNDVKGENVDQVELLKKVVDKLDFLPKGFKDAFDKLTNKEVSSEGLSIPRVENVSKLPKKIIKSMGYKPKFDIDGSHASGIDNVPRDGYIAELHAGEMVIPAEQANVLREQAGLRKERASKVKGPLNDSNDVVNSLDRRLIGTKNDYLKRIARDTRIIAAEVKGQLDGVGSNVFKTRKIVQQIAGMEDDDIKGSANKDRQGFFGKLRHAIYKPLDFAKNLIYDTVMKPIIWASEKITAVKEWFGEAFNTVKNFGKGLLKVGWDVTNFIGKTAGNIVNGLVKVGTEVGVGLAKVSATVGQMFIKGAGRLVSDIYGGAKFLATHAFKGIITGLETVGKVAIGAADTIGHAANFMGKMLVDTAKGIYTVTKDIAGFLYKGIKGVFTGALNIAKGAVSGVAKTIGFGTQLLFGKDKKSLFGGVKRVEVVGGRLDTVGSIDKPVQISNTNITNIAREVSSKTFEVNVKSLPVENNAKSQLRPLVQKSIPSDKNNVIQFPGTKIPNQKKMDEAAEKKKKQEEKEKEKKEEKAKNKEHTTRKTAEYMKNEIAVKKEKEATAQFQNLVSENIVAVAKTNADQYKFWDGIFGKNGTISKWLEAFKGIGEFVSNIKDFFGGEGGISNLFGGSGLLGTTANLLKTLSPFVPIAMVIGKQLLDANENLKNGADNLFTALLGQGDETRLDADGSYVYSSDKLEGTAKYFLRPKTRGMIAKAGLQGIETAKAYGKAGKAIIDKINPFKNKKVTEEVVDGGTKLLTNGTTGATKLLTGAVEPSVSLVDNAGNFIMDLSDNVAGNVAVEATQAGAKKGIGATIKSAASGAVSKAKNVTSNFTTTLAEKTKELVPKVTQVLDNIVRSICNGVAKKFPKLASFTSDISGKVISMASKALNNKNLMSKFSTKLTNFFVELGLSASTVGVVDVALGAWDGVTGFMEAANLFGVHKDQVDLPMRVISSAMKVITKFNVIQILDIVNEMVAEGFGINIKREIATLIYSAIPYSDAEGLEINQNAMEAEMQQYNAENGTQFTLETYLDKVSPTVGSAILGSDFTKNLMGTFSKNGAAALMNKDREDLTLADRATYGISHAVKNAFNFVGLDGDKAQQNIANTYKNTKSIFTKDGARSNMGLDEDAKLTFGDRMANLSVTGMNTIANLFRKDKVSNSEAMAYYTEQRNAKANKKIDEANAVLNDKNSSWISKQFAKSKKKRNEKKLGIHEKTSLWDKITGKDKKKSKNTSKTNISSKSKNTKDFETIEGFAGETEYIKQIRSYAHQMFINGEITVDEYKKYVLETGAMTEKEFNAMINDQVAGNGAGTSLESMQKKVSKKSAGSSNKVKAASNKATVKLEEEADKKINNTVTNSMSSVTDFLSKGVKKISDLFSKGTNNVSKTMTKDLETVNKNVNKGMEDSSGNVVDGFKKLIKKVTKISDDTAKDIDNKTKKDVEDLEKSNKGILSKTKDLISGIGNKVSDMVQNLFGGNDSKTKSSKKSVFSEIGDWFSNLGKGGKTTSTSVPTKPSTQEEKTVNNFTYYSQNDTRWGNKKSIGGETISNAGCGPTSVAMVMSQMYGKQITPDMIADIAPTSLPGYTTPGLFNTVAGHFNANLHSFDNINQVKQQLMQGRPVILSGKGSGVSNPYTNEGHIVVATGINGDTVAISDPRGEGLSKPYSLEQLAKGFNIGYTFTKPGHDDEQFTTNDGTYTDPGAIGDAQGNLGQTGSGSGKVRLFEKIIQYARAFKGKLKYSMDGNVRNWINNGKLGADCSSFTQHVYKTVAGIDIGANTGQQLTKGGQEISISSAQPGDLILFKGTYNSSHPRGVSHVGIVSDTNGNMIDQGSSSPSPKERNYNSNYWKSKQLTAIRVLSDPNKLVDPTVTGGNKALGTVVATPSGIPDVTGGVSSSGTSSNNVPDINEMGVFSKMSNIFQNFAASVYNGKEVDLFATNTSSDTSNGSYDANAVPVELGDLSGEVLNKHLKNSLANTGNTWFNEGVNNKVNPAFAVALANHETGYGTSNAVKNYNNPGGIMDKASNWKKLKKFSSISEGIKYTVQNLARRIYTDGNYTIQDLQKIYAPIGAANDPKGLNKNWVPNITSMYQKIVGSSDVKLTTEGVNFSAGKGPTYGYNGTYPSTMNNFAYYSQADPRWADYSFNGTNMAEAGCGPTSVAMVMSQLTGKTYDPTAIHKVSSDHITSAGSKWSLFEHAAKLFGTGINSSVSSASAIKAQLAKGNPVIMSGTSSKSDSPYTSAGHIVTAVGTSGDDILINDPRSPMHTKAYTKSQVESGLRGGWAFSKTSETGTKDVAGAVNTTNSTGNNTSTSSSDNVDELGAFTKMSNAFQNFTASVFNGKAVDLFATNTSSESSNTTTSDTSTTLSGNSVAEQIWNYTKTKGGSDAAAAGLVSNAFVESSFKPDTVNSIGASGLFQWLGDRKSKLMSRAKEAGKSWKDVGTQLDHVWWEMNGGDPYTKSLFDKNTGGWDGWLKYTDPYKAGYDFGKYFERGGHNEKRGNKAKEFYNKYSSAGKGGNCNDDSCFTTNLGKGEGNRLAKLTSSVTKQIKPKDVKIAGKGGNTTTPVTMKSKTLPSLKEGGVTKLTQNNNNFVTVDGGNNIANSCVELINTIISELKSINNNTANTVKAVSSIEIVPANASVTNVNQQNTNVQNGKQKYNGRMLPQGKDTGYDLAKRIASFA